MARPGSDELAAIREYIDNFDPQEFSSAADLDFEVCCARRKSAAGRIKARIRRRKEMAASFAYERGRASSPPKPMISQKEIDDLLAAYSASSPKNGSENA